MRTLTEEYLKDFLVRLAHHSSAIEGNTISLADTVSILVYNTIPGKLNKREFFEVENHRSAFDYLLDVVDNEEELSITLVKSIHAKLTDRLIVAPGEFKQSENAILGADFQTASVQQTPFLMKQWVDNVVYRLKMAKDNAEKISIIMESHIEFEMIHPFADGNGRTGRLLNNYLLLRNGFPPLIIEASDKQEYISYLANQDIDGLTKFVIELLKNEEHRIEQFANKEDVQIQEL